MARLLVVDDSHFQQKELSALLEDLGHEVLLANDGALALLLLEKESVDMALVDLHMPVLDGLGFLEEVRKLASPPPTYIISSDDFDYVVEQCVSLGAQGLLSKPVQKEALCAAIQKTISTKSC